MSTIFNLRVLLLCLLAVVSSPSFAADIENGKALHNENCVRCHQPEIYTREKRMVNSYAELHEQVRQCEIMAEMGWFEEEIDDVTTYLNETYYKFEQYK